MNEKITTDTKMIPKKIGWFEENSHKNYFYIKVRSCEENPYNQWKSEYSRNEWKCVFVRTVSSRVRLPLASPCLSKCGHRNLESAGCVSSHSAPDPSRSSCSSCFLESLRVEPEPWRLWALEHCNERTFDLIDNGLLHHPNHPHHHQYIRTFRLFS